MSLGCNKEPRKKRKKYILYTFFCSTVGGLVA
jgi:hypothetical protein